MENSEPRYTLEAYPIILVLAAIFVASYMNEGIKPQQHNRWRLNPSSPAEYIRALSRSYPALSL